MSGRTGKTPFRPTCNCPLHIFIVTAAYAHERAAGSAGRLSRPRSNPPKCAPFSGALFFTDFLRRARAFLPPRIPGNCGKRRGAPAPFPFSEISAPEFPAKVLTNFSKSIKIFKVILIR